MKDRQSGMNHHTRIWITNLVKGDGHLSVPVVTLYFGKSFFEIFLRCLCGW